MILTTDSGSVGELVERLNEWLRRLPPAQERIDRLIKDLGDRFGDCLDPVLRACVEIRQTKNVAALPSAPEFDPDGAALPDGRGGLA